MLWGFIKFGNFLLNFSGNTGLTDGENDNHNMEIISQFSRKSGENSFLIQTKILLGLDSSFLLEISEKTQGKNNCVDFNMPRIIA